MINRRAFVVDGPPAELRRYRPCPLCARQVLLTSMLSVRRYELIMPHCMACHMDIPRNAQWIDNYSDEPMIGALEYEQ